MRQFHDRAFELAVADGLIPCNAAPGSGGLVK